MATGPMLMSCRDDLDARRPVRPGKVLQVPNKRREVGRQLHRIVNDDDDRRLRAPRPYGAKLNRSCVAPQPLAIARIIHASGDSAVT